MKLHRQAFGGCIQGDPGSYGPGNREKSSNYASSEARSKATSPPSRAEICRSGQVVMSLQHSWFCRNLLVSHADFSRR
jgi:hypothetical protein